MKVAFRTDSSFSIGSGHLMRCLTLANELRLRGAMILYICREYPGHLINKLNESGFSVRVLPRPTGFLLSTHDDYAAWLGVTVEQDAEETLAALEGQLYDWLVVDHYGLSKDWESIIRQGVKNILVIDDLARHHDCDILLDQNYFCDMTKSRYIDRVPLACKSLLGPSYALLQPEYGKLRAMMPPRDGQICRVLVFLGGSDLTNQTAKILVALSCPNLTHLAVDVVIGPNHPDPEGIRFMVSQRQGTTLYQNLPSLAGLMAHSDLFIGAGGSTTWERFCLGLPSLVVSVAENQEGVTHGLVLDGYQISLSHGKNAMSLEWSIAIYELIKDHLLLSKLTKKSRELVDGLGRERVTHVMLGGEDAM